MQSIVSPCENALHVCRGLCDIVSASFYVSVKCVLISPPHWLLCSSLLAVPLQQNCVCMNVSVPVQISKPVIASVSRRVYICSSERNLRVNRFNSPLSLPLPLWQACGLPSSWLGVRTRQRFAIVWGSLCGPVGIWRRLNIRFYLILINYCLFCRGGWGKEGQLSSSCTAGGHARESLELVNVLISGNRQQEFVFEMYTYIYLGVGA